jgi:hypothetical protein
MSKPNILDAYSDSGDIRVLHDLLITFSYTNEEISEVLNMYESYDNNTIPEVEHIELLLRFYPNAKINNATLHAIRNSWPNRFPIIYNRNNQTK